MRNRLLTLAGLAVAVLALGCLGCKKAKGPVAVDPHSADGVMLRLQEQGKQLEGALARKDYTYLHDYGYYFTGLLQAFFSKLDDAEKQRLRGTLEQLVRLSGQLDRSAGGNRAEATEATVRSLLTLLKDLEKQFGDLKRGS